MQYVSTRDNFRAVQAAEAIRLGMVPGGGLFVPASVPRLDIESLLGSSYQEVARRVLSAFLDDFSAGDLSHCIASAYSSPTFDVDSIVGLTPLDSRRAILELWHGPTAAFKDVALQIMPHFLVTAKRMTGKTLHTVILVATSGDTGTAALEGFKNVEGISIVVFYPHGGVSDIQRLQMATVDGSNTHVLAVRGNFDDCQTAVKDLFADEQLAGELAESGIALSSANSINWGRLCPQVVYYFHAYLQLVQSGRIHAGEPIHFCVPTGNFGNILAGYYARAMGLPVDKLICASNKNKVLADFFATGLYDRKRGFHRTMSPSMDILISSNLERFLFEVTGHDAARVRNWYAALSENGRFSVDPATRAAMDDLILAGWVDEERVLGAIRGVFESSRYVVDTHTAVAAAVCEDIDPGNRYTVIDSTASPYKFSRNVLRGLSGEPMAGEFESIERLRELSGMPVHRAVAGLREKTVRHDRVIDVEHMRSALGDILEQVNTDEVC